MSLLSCVEIEPRVAAQATVIWLHGLGANGHDFEPIVPELGLPAAAPVRFLFPHAPAMPVTINNGMVMPAWYDILEMNIERRVDETQLRASARAVAALLDREIERGIASQRLLLAGFSQGGAVAFETALGYPQPLAGLLSLSSYFATAATVAMHEANRDLPILICHGTRDPLVPEALGRRSAELLRERGYRVEYRSYPMEHAVCMEEVRDIGAWLRSVLL